MKIAIQALCILFATGVSAVAENAYMMNIPVGWGNHTNRDICERIIDTGGVDCELSLVNIETTAGTDMLVTYMQISGEKDPMKSVVNNDFSPFPLGASDQKINDLFEGFIPEIAIPGNRCLAAVIPPGCVCADTGVGELIIECDELQKTNPWEIPELGVNVGTLIPNLPTNGSLLRLQALKTKQNS